MRAALLSGLLLACPLAPQDPTLPAERQLAEARALVADGKPGDAWAAVLRALEFDPRHYGALALAARLAADQGDRDAAVHAWHLWLDVHDGQRRPAALGKERGEILKALLEKDPKAQAWATLQEEYVRNLVQLARDYRSRKDLLGAIEALGHVLQVDPHHEAAKAAIAEIRRTGGREVAVEDLYAGGDPTAGLSAEQIESEDRKHAEWDKAWTKETDNYRYRTNAGFLVLQTSAIAMEQMNRFYRRFFRFKEDGGKTPQIEIRIFKSRDEYLSLGRNPAPWSGGHFTGDSVETYVGGVSGKESVRDMYRTLFHEAAHQFVSLTGPMVPGWLNEAFASFFEGCTILSNGTVRWNQVPAGRLFPLATRLENGFAASAEEGVRDEKGEWAEPRTAPRFRHVVQGGYAWGPPWYAPTWGVVYFLYNFRDPQGRPVYRDVLHAYYLSFKRGQPKDPILHFEETVLRAAPLSPVRTIDELDDIWRRWILELRDRETGKTQRGAELLRLAKAARERADLALALEFLDEANGAEPGRIDVLQELATLLEELKLYPRAAAAWRELARELELGGREPELLGRARDRVLALDPLARAYQRMKTDLARRGIELARDYEARGLPTMALEIARRMSANFSIPEAMGFYAALAERTGKSLARWRVAYDERSLAGWSGGDGVYQAYGATIRAQVPAGEAMGSAVVTSELTCDVTFDADFSLEAEMRIPKDEEGLATGSLMGLCFGRKDADHFHAVVLHAKGFLDVATKNGGSVWTVRDHRQVTVSDAWRRLRIDVVGRSVDLYLDGLYVRSLELENRETVRGTFGLITGPGRAEYRRIRLLARERFDPAARIERSLAMQRVAKDLALRAPGSFTGLEPPPLRLRTVVQGDPAALAERKGKPVMLVFWTPAQDRAIPTQAWLAHVAEAYRQHGLVMIVVCDGGTRESEVRAYLAEKPLPGAIVALDEINATYDAYFLRPGFFGLPRVLLVDRDGKVTFEGDPGFRAGIGWRPEDGPTYVDESLRRLLGL
ncbi:MAG: TlpA family protein disulfide reductase [Planctomycetes bacterium]|nr:TlpA family protein disulfide reductase [Planctomycetota bacterium]